MAASTSSDNVTESTSIAPEKEGPTTPLLAEMDSSVPPVPSNGPKMTGVAKGVPATGMERGFYQHFMNPVMAKMEEQVRKNNDMLDEIQHKLEKEREDNRKKKLSEHIPDTIKGTGQELKAIIKHIEDLIVYENYEKDGEKDSSKFVKARLKQLDENSEVAILSHSIGAFVSTLEPQHLRHFTNRIVQDVTLWLSRLFRFKDASAYFHEEDREGLVRICRLALHNKYPKFGSDGYEALYARPPMIYVSAAAKPLLGQHLCSQLGLPISCLNTVPCSNSLGTVQKMDVDALISLIEQDKDAGKTPVLVVAYAGTPVVGSTDNLQKLQDLCKKESIWLHLEGNNLATLTMYSVPTEILPAKSGDSMTLNLNGWLGLPAVPYVTLYKSGDASLARNVGLVPTNRFRLNCVPLWTCLQNLGHEGVVSRIKYSLDLSKRVHEHAGKLPSLVNVVLFEIENPTTVFRYQPQIIDEQSATAGDNASTDGTDSTVPSTVRDPYFDALNIWLYETLRRDAPRVHITAVELEEIGVCLRFAPMESGQLFDTTKDDIEQFMDSLERQVRILDATVDQRADFQDVVEAQDNLRLVDLPNWAGLGAVHYVSEAWLDKLDNLSDVGKTELNALNINLVHQLKSADTAFSLGQTDDGLNCVRFGLITEDTDLEELIALVYTTGKEVEESSKFLETMAEIVRQGITKANEDLSKESQQKLQEEGVLRQVPLVGSLLNWWAPADKAQQTKGRTFNLASGKIESTETTYKYHMQVQESTPEPSPRVKDGPLKANLKPAKRRPHSRSASDASLPEGGPPAEQPEPATPTSPVAQEVITEGNESGGEAIPAVNEAQPEAVQAEE